MAASYRLGDLAQRFGLALKGEAGVEVSGVCALAPGQPGHIGFLANPKLRAQMEGTRAAAVILRARDAENFHGNALIAADPYAAYARVAALFDVHAAFAADVRHPSAVIAADARIGAGCHIAAHAVIGAGAVIGDGCYIGPQCVIGEGAVLGAGVRLTASVYVWHGCRIGARCHVQPGAVIGARGFGNAPTASGWVEVPQLGNVIIGDDVEIGANTTIDRGAIGDTVIGDGVKLDNQIQIAHNVRIGAHTAIAACTGIAGSAQVGAGCMIGGGCGIAGHIEIADGTVVLAYSLVTRSLQKGVYGSGQPVSEAREWRRQTAHIRRLGRTEQRLRALERRMGLSEPESGDTGESDD